METTGTTNKPYDLTAIKAMCDNNISFLNKLLVVFTDNLAIDLNAMKEAASVNNWPEVGQMAHKMKSSLMHFGVVSLKDTIAGLEHYGNSSEQALNGLVIEFESVVNSVIIHLKQEFPDVFNQ